MKLENYKCDGQMNIFDFIEKPKPKRVPPIDRYLRYGPHTLIPEVREETRIYLEQNGVPEWVKWDKNSLPCQNCTWYDGSSCGSGGHTCHYEFDYLICDMFRQSIVERKPSTVGDVFPSYSQCEHSGHKCNKFNLWEVADTFDDIKCPHVCCRNCNLMCGARCNGSEQPKEIADEYIKENPTCFYVFGHYLDREDGWHKVPEELPTFTEWTLIDVVLFGKKTSTTWIEHGKWQAKDWTFKRVDGDTPETTEVLAWKVSD